MSVGNITTEPRTLFFLSSGGGFTPALCGSTGWKIQRFCCCTCCYTCCCWTGSSEYIFDFQQKPDSTGLNQKLISSVVKELLEMPNISIRQRSNIVHPATRFLKWECVGVNTRTGKTTSVQPFISAVDLENRKFSLSVSLSFSLFELFSHSKIQGVSDLLPLFI